MIAAVSTLYGLRVDLEFLLVYNAGREKVLKGGKTTGCSSSHHAASASQVMDMGEVSTIKPSSEYIQNNLEFVVNGEFNNWAVLVWELHCLIL